MNLDKKFALGTFSSCPMLFVLCCGVTSILGCNGSDQQQHVAEIIPVVDAESSPVVEFEFSDSDWPQWRGKDGNGIAVDQSLPVSWDDVVDCSWQAEIPGQGHASPILVGNLAIVATAVKEPEQKQLIVAYDRANGDQKWIAEVHVGGFAPRKEIHFKATYANSTLASDGERIFGSFFNDNGIWVTAVDLSGQRVWQTKVGPFKSKFGYAPSPILYGSVVIVAADNSGAGYLAALNRSTGEIVWLKKRPTADSYSSPMVARIAGKDQLIISGCDQIASYNPATGQELWSCDAIAEATCGTAVTDGIHVFASGGYPDRETVCVAADGTGEIKWRNNTKLYETSLLIWGDHLYGITDKGIAHCWEAATGTEKWKQRLSGEFSASPVVCNGRIYVPNLDGQVFVFQAEPTSYQEIAVNKTGDNIYASPAMADGDLVLRVGFGEGNGRKEKLICIRKQDLPTSESDGNAKTSASSSGP